MLTACAGGNKLSVFAKGDAPLDVDLPDVCEGFLTPVAEPPRQHDARVAAVRYADAFHEVSDRLVAGRDCERDERAAYKRKQQKGKPK